MPNTIRIKRRPSNNSANTLPELRNAELAFNEYKKTLYYGLNGASDGSATDATALAIAGDGAVWTGTATFGTVNTTGTLTVGDEAYAYSNTAPAANEGDSAGKLLATVQYVDEAVSRGTGTGMTLHSPDADCATTAPIVTVSPYERLAGKANVKIAVPQPQSYAGSLALYELRGTPTVQSVQLAAGDRVLILGHLDASKKGIWTIPAGATATTAWVREANSEDLPTWFQHGVRIFVTHGTYANHTFELASNPLRATNDVTIPFAALNFVSNKTNAPSSVPAAPLFKRIVRAKDDYYQIVGGKVVVDGVVLEQQDRFIWTPTSADPGGFDLGGEGGSSAGLEFGDATTAAAGIYRVNYDRQTNGDPYAVIVRVGDLNTDTKFREADGTKVLVREGTLNANTIFTINTSNTFAVGVDTATFDSATAFTGIAGALAGTPVIDGYATVAEERDGNGDITKIGSIVLVKNETDPTTNGLYYIPQPTGGYDTTNVPWVRHSSADENGELIYGSYIRVKYGNVNKNTGFVQVTNLDPITIGSDPLVFQSPQNSLDFRAGVGLERDERTLYVKTASTSRITVTEAGVDLATVASVATDGLTTADAYIFSHVDQWGRVTPASGKTISASDLRSKISSLALDDATTGTQNLVFSDSPTLTGTPIAPTPDGNTATQIATVEYVNNSLSTGGGNQLLAADNTWTGVNTFQKTTGTRFEQAANKDAIIIVGADSGSAGHAATITTAALSQNVTITLPAESGTLVLTSDSRLTDARTPTSHSHGSIDSDGKIGSTANLPLITGADGLVQTGSFGTSANTFCEGDDARLSDTRTPTTGSVTTSSLDATATTGTAGSIVLSDSPTLVTPDIGTPSAGTLTNCSGLPVAGLSDLDADVATFLTTPSGANLASAVDDTTGTGDLVFATSPTLTTSVITDSAAFDVFNTVATTVNAFGAAIALNFGAVTGTTTVRNNLVVAGDFTVNGVTTVVNSTTVSIDDPIFTLGGPTLLEGGEDNALPLDTKDRGIEFYYTKPNDVAARQGFFGWDRGEDVFTCFTDATNTSEVFSGTLATGRFAALKLDGDTPAITTTASTASVFNSTATTLNMGGAATTLNIGGATTESTTNIQTATGTTNKTINIGTGRTGGTTNINLGPALSSGVVSVALTTASTSTTTGAFTVAGGVGIGGRVNVGGMLTLAAGSTAANTAALKFQSGSQLTTPEAGAVEWNGTNLFITNSSSARKTIAYTDDDITGNAANVTGTVVIANGGTGETSKTAAFDALAPTAALGDLLYHDGNDNVGLSGNTATSKKFLTQTGTGSVSAAPAWEALTDSDLPTEVVLDDEANTFTNAAGQKFQQAATNDAIVVKGRAGGADSRTVTLETAALTDNRVIAFPDAGGTLLTTENVCAVVFPASTDGCIVDGGNF